MILLFQNQILMVFEITSHKEVTRYSYTLFEKKYIITCTIVEEHIFLT